MDVRRGIGRGDLRYQPMINPEISKLNYLDDRMNLGLHGLTLFCQASVALESHASSFHDIEYLR